jgi:hypothetical protein
VIHTTEAIEISHNSSANLQVELAFELAFDVEEYQFHKHWLWLQTEENTEIPQLKQGPEKYWQTSGFWNRLLDKAVIKYKKKILNFSQSSRNN